MTNQNFDSPNFNKFQFIYFALNNSIELLEEQIDMPSDLDSGVLVDSLDWFASISEMNEFDFVQGDEEGYWYIREFLNNEKLLKLQEYIIEAQQMWEEDQASQIQAALEGERGWGD